MSRAGPVVASCGLVQVVHLTWGKSARGGEAARLRNAVPLAFSFPLDQKAEGGEHLHIQEWHWGEANGFVAPLRTRCHSRPVGKGFGVKGVSVAAQSAG